jgi:hypothetical protein
MPFWAAHGTVSSTASAASQRIGQGALYRLVLGWPLIGAYARSPSISRGAFRVSMGVSRHEGPSPTATRSGAGDPGSCRLPGGQNVTALRAQPSDFLRRTARRQLRSRLGRQGTLTAGHSPDHGQHMDGGPARACVLQKHPWPQRGGTAGRRRRPGEEWPALLTRPLPALTMTSIPGLLGARRAQAQWC